jgi:stage V sporulation protein G
MLRVIASPLATGEVLKKIAQLLGENSARESSDPATNEYLAKAYVFICLDDYFPVHDIRVIKGSTGLFISFPNRTQSEGGQRDIAFPVNAETRNMIEQAVLAEYEKVVAQTHKN